MMSTDSQRAHHFMCEGLHQYGVLMLWWWGGYLTLTGALRFFTEYGVFPVLFLLGLPISLAALSSTRSLPRSFWLFLVAIAIFSIPLVYLLSLRWESRWDAVAYHLPAIVYLMEGWNPTQQSHSLLWADSYPNGWWTLQASFASLLDHVMPAFETGRWFNYSLLLASFGLVLRTILITCGRLTAPMIAVAIVLVGNPVVLIQLHTHLNDGPLYLTYICLVSSLLIALKESSVSSFVTVAASIVLLFSTKISAPYWGASACAIVFAGYWLRTKRIPLRAASFCMMVAILAIVLINWRPYTSNMIEHETLIYPDPASHLPNHYPRDVVGMNRFEKLARHFTIENANKQRVFPWQLSTKDLGKLSSRKQLNSGFGVTFVAGFMLAALSALVARRHSRDWLILYAGSTILVTTAIFPENWDARFIAPLWSVPVLLAFIPWLSTNNIHARQLASLVLSTLSLSILLAGSTAQYVNSVEHWKSVDLQTKWIVSEIEQRINKDEAIHIGLNEKTSKVHSHTTWQRRLQDRGTKCVLTGQQECQPDQRKAASRLLFGVPFCF